MANLGKVWLICCRLEVFECCTAAWEKGHNATSMQASKNIQIEICVVTEKEPQALPLLSSREIGHQAIGKQVSEVVDQEFKSWLRMQIWGNTIL